MKLWLAANKRCFKAQPSPDSPAFVSNLTGSGIHSILTSKLLSFGGESQAGIDNPEGASLGIKVARVHSLRSRRNVIFPEDLKVYPDVTKENTRIPFAFFTWKADALSRPDSGKAGGGWRQSARAPAWCRTSGPPETGKPICLPSMGSL